MEDIKGHWNDESKRLSKLEEKEIKQLKVDYEGGVEWHFWINKFKKVFKI